MLSIQEISKIWGKGTPDERVALDRLSMELAPGDFLTVIGGNGSGKSTLLNLISGVHPVDSGRIYMDGADITRLAEHKRAAYLSRVFQDPLMGTAGGMTVEENMALAARRGKSRGLVWGVSRGERDGMREALRRLDLGLEDRLSSKAGLLSGGQRQALTLLMAAMCRPKVLLLDEHTAALDPKTAGKVIELTKKIVGEYNLTTIMVTHSMKEAIECGNRLVMMQEGRIAFAAEGAEKRELEISDLLGRFKISGMAAG